jgi:hypothetical protein
MSGFSAEALKDVAGIEAARLIDAHSFCWMLVRLKLTTEATATNIPLPEGLLVTAAPGVARPAAIADTEFDVVEEAEFARRDYRAV